MILGRGREPMSTATPRSEAVSGFEIVESTHDRDPTWDEFVERVEWGQYQQSSLWARAKAGEGFRSSRWVLRRQGGEIVGGFQVLCRRSRIGLRYGYVSKGPVRDCAFSAAPFPGLLKQAVRRLGLAVLLVQPPDGDQQLAQALEGAGFFATDRFGVITANLEIDLSLEEAELMGRMRRHTRQEVRQAFRRGVTIVQGGPAELPLFFELMKATCRRRGVEPRPSSLERLRDYWNVFAAEGKGRLTLARCEDRFVAGLLCLFWGERCSLWKKGWSGEFPERHPTAALYWEALTCAKARGYSRADFGGLARPLAEAILREGKLPEAARRSRDFFNLGFGGTPVLLPLPYAWSPFFPVCCFLRFVG
ncbi:MAG: hypothetical protein Kow00109_05960 [Acidobacteriota bacterium]